MTDKTPVVTPCLLRDTDQVLLNHLNYKDEGEDNHYDGGYPCDRIEDRAICIIHHQLLVIDEQKHEYEDKGESHSIDHLREVHDRDQRNIRIEDDSCS